jgi:cell division septal protein FtsQ
VRRQRISLRLRMVLWAIAVLLPAGAGIYGLVTFALESPCFVLASPADVVVEGGHYVSREEVLGALGLRLTGNPQRGTNVFRLSLDDLRREVETLRWVRTASVARVLPHGLLVRITERTPVAYANVAGRVSLVDEDGYVLDKPDSGIFDFPVLYGLDNVPGADDRRARLALYQEFNRQLGEEAPRAGWMISEVYLADAEDLKALLISGRQTVQAHFGDKDFLARFRNFLALLPEIQKSNDKIESVDLRYHNQVVVDPQTPAPSPEPPAGGERKD